MLMNGKKVKSFKKAALLSIFLGGFGAHNIYLGEKKKAAIHISLALVQIVLVIVYLALHVKTYHGVFNHHIHFHHSQELNIIQSFIGLAGIINTIWGMIELLIILRGGYDDIEARGFICAERAAKLSIDPMADDNAARIKERKD